MIREKPHLWRCEHLSPIEVVAVGVGKRARCLVCGACGPVREGSKEAMLALREEGRYREEALRA
jgi:hypothetical protein